MFARLPDAGTADVPVTIDGAPFAARAGDTVAATLLASGRLAFRATPITGAARGPYCMMGACFDCLVAIDGRPNQQACMVTVAPGMRIETGQGVRSVVPDAGDAR
jgi:predicted molibdopterin-dependent oxidoreductase YjgC